MGQSCGSEKDKGMGQRYGSETFDNCSCVIFDGYYKSSISGRKTGNLALSPPNFDLSNWNEFQQKSVHADNFAQNIWNELTKPRRIG